MANPENIHCGGCDTVFVSRRGLKSHLLQTKDPLCRLVARLNKDKRRDRGTSDPESSGGSGSENGSSDGSIHPFGGDVFGTAEDYSVDNEDFGQVYPDEEVMEVDGVDLADEGSDGEEARLFAEDEDGWEAPREDVPPTTPIDANDDDTAIPGVQNAAASLEDDSGAAAAENRLEAELPLFGEGHGVTPKKTVRYSDKYPHCRAGAAVTQEESMDTQYEASIHGAKNPWAPFTSSIDWRLAKWAKLRGSGSTAFSELLALEGVSEYPGRTLYLNSP